MSEEKPDGLSWEEKAGEDYKYILGKIPIFLRGTAEKKVGKKAEALAREEGCAEIGEKHLVDAFFIETPFGFHGPLKNDMEERNIEYAQYGHSK